MVENFNDYSHGYTFFKAREAIQLGYQYQAHLRNSRTSLHNFLPCEGNGKWPGQVLRLRLSWRHCNVSIQAKRYALLKKIVAYLAP